MKVNLSRAAHRCKKHIVFFAVFVVLALALVVGAVRAEDGPLNKLQSPAVKAQTVQAIQAINKGQWSRGRELIAATKDPLAAKLYFWLSFTRGKDESGYTHLVQFIRKNPEWPGVRNLIFQAEKAMPKDLSAAEVVTWFNDYPPQTSLGIDRYLGELITGGRNDQAREILSNWWSNTKLPRDEQRYIYKKYKAYIPHEAHVRRLDRLLHDRHYENATGIAQVLGEGYPALAQARIALAEKRGDVNNLIAAVPSALQNDPGLLYERLKWRREKDLNNGAIEILRMAPPADQITNPDEWWQERHIIIRRLTEEKKFAGAYLLASEHRQTDGFSYAQAEWMAGWLALSFLHDAPKALEHFQALYSKVETPISKARAAYWAGRAAKALGQAEISTEWFKRAAQYQTVFYGQMAGAQLGLESALPHAAPPLISAVDLAQLKARELVQAAAIFNEAGMRAESSDFIQAFIRHEATPQAYLFAAEESARMGQYHDAVRIAKKATNEGLFLTAQSYPLMVERLKAVNIEWALVHALIRQESLFDEQAQSPAGALGLMQLMPGTAKDVARSLGVPHQAGWLTARPEHNIVLGSQYLNDLIVRFGGSYPLAIAAYNAGPVRVDRWLKTFGDPRIGEVDMVDWIELIPIYETRNYVQRVMESVYVYRIRLKDIQPPPQEAIHIAMRYKK